MACTDIYRESDEQSEEEEITPPSETYHHEDGKQYCLNVVYYVPSDGVEVSDWHYRLSGMTLKIQEYFEENFGYYGVENKMGLVVNDSSESYIKMHLIKSQYPAAELHEGNMAKMAAEILDYYTANPDEKTSDHYMVWMPEYSGCFIKHYFPDTKSGMTFAGVDNDRWKPSYFESPRATAVFLSDFGLLLKTFAHSLFLPESSSGLEHAYLALMGASGRTGGSSAGYKPDYNYKNYAGTSTAGGGSVTYGTPDKVRLMIWDVRYLNGTQLFNDDYSYEPLEVKVDREKVRIWSKDTACSESGMLYEDWWRQDTIFMEVPFSASAELAGVLLLDDGWTSYNVGTTSVTNTQDTTLDRDPMKDTGYDAYGVYLDVTALEETADGYIARFALPLGNNIYPFYGGTSVQRNPVKHELRLRFIGRNGMAYPHYPTSVKGETENADGKEAIVSDYRYPFTFNSKTQGGEYCMWVDIPWRYSGWVRDGEENPTKPE